MTKPWQNVLLLLLAVYLLAGQLQAEEQPLHPIVDRYLRGLNGVGPNQPFKQELRRDLHISLQLSKFEGGQPVAGKRESTQVFLRDAEEVLLLVGATAVLSRQNVVWMTTESLRAPLRISNGFALWGEANVTDVLGVPLNSYDWSDERKDEETIRLFP